MLDARGRVVLITGCDSGIGREACRLLARSPGLKLVAACLTEPGRRSLLEELAGSAASVLGVLLDVTRADDVDRVVRLAAALSDNGRSIHAVINNAGTTGGSFAEWTPIAEYQRVLEVNFLGAVRVSLAAMPYLRAARGRLIALSSATAIEGLGQLPSISAYASSKAALDVFCRCLRAEVAGAGVRVLTINPGFTNTALVSQTPHTAERLWNSLEPDARAHWGDAYAHAFLARARLAARLVVWPASGVAVAVAHATLARWPCRRYWPSPDAALLFRPITLAPDWLTDTLLSSLVSLGMPPLPLPAGSEGGGGGGARSAVAARERRPARKVGSWHRLRTDDSRY
jgi:NAD(P)-dependent dehydrogenase (short-subunit alcohol dehydrogenase family)